MLIISSGGRVLETINVDQRVGRLVPPADKRLLKQTVNPLPPFSILHSSFSPPSGAISGAAIGELGTKGKDAPIALKWSLHPILHCQLHCTEQICILYCSKLHCSSATPVQAQCTNRQLGFTQILSLLQNEHCNGNGWARSCEGPSATFSEEADCTAVQPYHHQSNCSANGAECMHCCDSDLLMHTIFFGSFCAFAMSVCFILHVLANLWF